LSWRFAIGTLAKVSLNLSPELLALVRGRLTHRLAGEPFLAVVQVLIDPFLAAQLSNAVFAAQAFHTMRIFSSAGMLPTCHSTNIPIQRSSERSLVSSLLHNGATMSQVSLLRNRLNLSDKC
jgi:hypothetical protein